MIHLTKRLSSSFERESKIGRNLLACQTWVQMNYSFRAVRYAQISSHQPCRLLCRCKSPSCCSKQKCLQALQ
ncbi:hypothetical protein HOLleu_40267 [Holothuria leucospilota]|uniref:Uncharacterized protein n=1 Tax=Holothuria leucospilota TaxID=206669 RepID=A0A9Q1BCP5_HOLLE|nr:hypothetical protein HOLleu_40267 [Holothuria leucospilota]